jgi:hypothetical protein
MGAALAEEKPSDVFQGKLFAPNVILEHRDQLQLSKEQFTAIRAAVVEVQAGVAEHEWDMQEAYQALMLELEKSPIDEDKVLEHAGKALLAENQVKKKQMAMLVRLKNLLSAAQVDYLERMHATE